MSFLINTRFRPKFIIEQVRSCLFAPSIRLTYAAKGSEFDNVFVPFANSANTASRNAFYVACTRASRQLFISYSGKKTSYLNDVNPKDIEMVDMTKQSPEAIDW